MESFKNDIIKAVVADRRPGIDPCCDVADALFYYEAALQASYHAVMNTASGAVPGSATFTSLRG